MEFKAFPFQISTDCKGENSNLLFKASHKTQHLHFTAKKYACFQWDTVENKKGAHEVVSECGTRGGVLSRNIGRRISDITKG